MTLNFLRIAICLLGLSIGTCLHAQYEVTNNRYRAGNSGKIEPIKNENAEFWNSLAHDIDWELHRKGGKTSFDPQKPVEINLYIESYLVVKEIFPNKDAVDLIRALNPDIKNAKDIPFYTPLRMPSFKNVKGAVQKKLTKEQEQLSVFDQSSYDEFLKQLNDFQTAAVRYKNNKISFRFPETKKEFDSLLSEVERFVEIYKKRKFQRGTSVFIAKEVKVLNQLLDEIITDGSAFQRNLDVLKSIKDDLYFPSLLDPSFPETSSLDKEEVNSVVISRSATKTLSQGKENNDIYKEVIFAVEYYSGGGASTKLCQLYAKTTAGDGRPVVVDIPSQFYFSYQSKGQATYRCHPRSDKCTGFNEGPDLISANGVNIVPGNYVFRFRDKDHNNLLFFRCYTKEMFERVFESAGNTKKTRFKLIFNPDSANCEDYLSN